MSSMIERISEIEAKVRSLEESLADPLAGSDPGKLAKAAKELRQLKPIAEAAASYRSTLRELENARAMLEEEDAELVEMAKAEVANLEQKQTGLEETIDLLLLPRDPRDDRDVILEIRAGAGGDEAALFAADLFRMYARYAEAQRWKVEEISRSLTDGGGLKEGIFAIRGQHVFGRLKHERGVHRVQRVPVTEAQGRVHTSTVTVAILAEAEEIDVEIKPTDLRVDVFRSSGPGGQSVNTTDSAVRVTHLPTGLVVQCQDEKSQHKNKAKALTVLRSRLLEAEEAKMHAERAGDRKQQVGTGDRSERIRTYNYAQSRVTDHRAGVTLHKLDAILEGDLDELLDGVSRYFNGLALKETRA